MKKKVILLIALVFSIGLLTACVKEEAPTIQMNEPAKRIISLYSAHTENLFALGLDEEIIGVGKSDAYPVNVTTKDVYDYRSDPEKVIAADPDLVLIRPFIKKSKPEFVEALENAGIKVVSLYPNTFEKFPEYVRTLATLTGKEEVAEEKLKQFDEELKALEEKTKNIEPKINVFFEATETEYRTITTDSMAARAIRLAGGNNIASDAKAMREGTTIASYGEERILEKADQIDVYVSQRGAMSSGGNLHSIMIRPGFDAVKAVEDKRVYTIDEKLVSSPTFRFTKGIKELTRMFYPEIMDDLTSFKTEDELTKSTFAKSIVMFTHKGIFAPTSKYYGKKHRGHIYGTFEDVPVDREDFDYIETAVLSGFISSDKTKFEPDKKVTREDLAKALYLLGDLKDNQNSSLIIKDIDECDNDRIVEMVVKNKLMLLEDGKFNPNRIVTQKEAIEAMERLKNI
ncbi:ABC transporter substrate-binding protein [Lutibacter sp. B2]|nr:ABC transporter substrate-binding protein [Lutibacter sp. B2]